MLYESPTEGATTLRQTIAMGCYVQMEQVVCSGLDVFHSNHNAVM